MSDSGKEALQHFNGIYGQKPQLIQDGSLMAMMAPLILFMLAQPFFVQGIVITGVDKLGEFPMRAI